MTKISNLNTNENNVRVRRVRVSEQTEEVLEQIVKKYGCTYNGRLSISGLLSQIADGRLEVSQPKLPLVKHTKISVPLIELEIEIISNLNGTIAEIAKKIADFKGNIYRAKASENNTTSHIKIELSIPENSNLTKLVKSIYEIKVSDILTFNETEKLEKLLELIDPASSRSYESSRIKNKNIKIEDFFQNNNTNYQEESLIKNVTCTVAFQAIIPNQPGTLDKLTHQIAEQRISICSVDIDVDYSQGKNIVNLCLGFSPSLDNVYQKIESIHKFMKHLQSLEYVDHIKLLDIKLLNKD